MVLYLKTQCAIGNGVHILLLTACVDCVILVLQCLLFEVHSHMMILLHDEWHTLYLKLTKLCSVLVWLLFTKHTYITNYTLSNYNVHVQ